MTAHPQDRERLAKMLTATSVPVRVDRRTWDDTLAWADRLLAAGVTLPPAPKPPLLTEQQVGECWTKTLGADGWARWDRMSKLARDEATAFANAAAEAAIRGRVKAETTVLEGVNALGEDESEGDDESEWFIPPAVLLALFGLEGE